jgi:hypothetical protein
VTDARRSAPHVARNTGPILELLRETLPQRGLVLEVASGSGEQSLAFARAFPKLLWQPSDPDPAGLASIEAWRDNEAVFNLLPPVELDARTAGWPIASAEAIVCINMVHISPYRRQGVPTVPSNEAFDESLTGRNPGWGLRTIESVAAEAERNGLTLERVVQMPANNLSVIFRRV